MVAEDLSREQGIACTVASRVNLATRLAVDQVSEQLVTTDIQANVDDLLTLSIHIGRDQGRVARPGRESNSKRSVRVKGQRYRQRRLTRA